MSRGRVLDARVVEGRELRLGLLAIVAILGICTFLVYDVVTKLDGASTSHWLGAGACVGGGAAFAAVLFQLDRIAPELSRRLGAFDWASALGWTVGAMPLLQFVIPDRVEPFIASFGLGYLFVGGAIMSLALAARVIPPHVGDGLTEAEGRRLQVAQRGSTGLLRRVRRRR